MRNIGFVLWWGWMFFVPALPGQNLVPNPDFDQFVICPPYPGQVHLALPWDSPNNKTTDFYHRCAEESTTASVPANFLGFQQPVRGDGYLGIRSWIPVIDGNPPYREYASVRLSQPLQRGHRYRTGYWISMAERSSHQSDGLGLWFSDQPLRPDSVYLPEPDLRHPVGQIIRSVEAWHPVRRVYTAGGGENYLTIGNFQSDEAMIRLERAPGERPSVYYFLDAVFVEPCPESPEPEVTLDTQLCQGQSLKIVLDTAAWTITWADGSQSGERIFSQPGTYVVDLDYGCYQQSVSYRLSDRGCDCSFRQQGPNPDQWEWPLELIRSETTLFDARGRYMGAFSRDALVAFAKNLPSGLYFYEMQLTCANISGRARRQTGTFIIVTR